MMKTGINKLNEHLDQIVIWLRENPTMKISDSLEERAYLILGRIAGLEKMSNSEFERLATRSLASPQSTVYVKAPTEITECLFCRVSIRRDRVAKHQLICPKRPVIKTVDGKKKFQSYQSYNIGYLPNPDLPDHKTERRLDGAKEFHQFRDQGKYGSHASYDNYDDESFA